MGLGVENSYFTKHSNLSWFASSLPKYRIPKKKKKVKRLICTRDKYYMTERLTGRKVSMNSLERYRKLRINIATKKTPLHFREAINEDKTGISAKYYVNIVPVFSTA